MVVVGPAEVEDVDTVVVVVEAVVVTVLLKISSQYNSTFD